MKCLPWNISINVPVFGEDGLRHYETVRRATVVGMMADAKALASLLLRRVNDTAGVAFIRHETEHNVDEWRRYAHSPRWELSAAYMKEE